MSQSKKRKATEPVPVPPHRAQARQNLSLALLCLESAIKAADRGDVIEVRVKVDAVEHFLSKLEYVYPRPRAKTGT